MMKSAFGHGGWRVEILAGTGQSGFAGDGASARSALLNNPFDLAYLADGSVVFSDTYNHRLRRIDAVSGIIETIAGTGEAGCSGDGGPAPAASMNQPYGVVASKDGRIFVADRLNGRVRVIAADGTMTTLAVLQEPNGLALSPDQRRLFIADVAGHRVYVADLASGVVSVFAGTGEAAHTGDGGACSAAGIFGARAVAFTPDGALLVMERQGSSIRLIRDGIIQTIAGTGARGYAGDGGVARDAVFDAPKEMAVAPNGDIFVVDTENNAIRRIRSADGIVETIAADLARPHGALVAPDGSLIVGDSEHHQLCRLIPPR